MPWTLCWCHAGLVPQRPQGLSALFLMQVPFSPGCGPKNSNGRMNTIGFQKRAQNGSLGYTCKRQFVPQVPSGIKMEKKKITPSFDAGLEL